MKKLPVILVFLFCAGKFFAQPVEADWDQDSLRHILATSGNDTVIIQTMNHLAWMKRTDEPDSSEYYSRKALELSEKKGWLKGKAFSLHHLGLFRWQGDEYDQALEYYDKALKIFEILEKNGEMPLLEIEDCRAVIFANIGSVYGARGDYPLALQYYLEAIHLDKKLNKVRSVASMLGNIGTIYRSQGDTANAFKYYREALVQKRKNGQTTLFTELGNMGNVYADAGMPIKALEFYKKALEYVKISPDQSLEVQRQGASLLGNIGTIYYELQDYEKALEYGLAALEADRKLGSLLGVAIDLGNIGSIYTATGQFDLSETYLKSSLSLSDSIGDLYGVMEMHRYLTRLYDTTGRYELAYRHHRLFAKASDSLFNDEKSKDIGRLEAKYEYDKQQAVAETEHRKELELADESRKQQEMIMYASIAGLLLVVVFGVFIFNRLRVTAAQKTIIEKQKAIVEEKQKEILDSIYYAKRIQQSLLPSEKYLEKALKAK